MSLGPSELEGRRILVTGPEGDRLARQLEERGATALRVPMIAIRPVPEGGPLDDAVRRLERYDWIVLTSPRGARAVFDRRRALGLGLPPCPPRWAAVGPLTAAAITAGGAPVSWISAGGRGAALAAELGRDVEGASILLPRARIAARGLPEALAARGARVDDVPAYETEVGPERSRAPLAQALVRGLDAVVFTSGSTVDGFAKLTGDLAGSLAGVATICIGPSTARVLDRHGVRASSVADRRTPDALVRAIERGIHACA